MDFGLDPTQQEIAELAARTLDRDGEQTPAQGWRALVDSGLLGLALPPSSGGDGLGLAGAAVVLTELGRRAVAAPALATLALGALPLARHGSRAQQEAHLPGVVKEGRVLTAALHEPSEPLPTRPRTLARRDGDHLVVSGTKVMVPYAQRADRVLVPVTLLSAGDTSSTGDTSGTGVLLVDPRAAGVRLTPAVSAGHEPHHHLTLTDVRVPVADLIGHRIEDRVPGAAGPASAVLPDLYRLAVVAAALTADGLLAGALTLTTAHVGTRQQFGRPLATLQAVAQQIADVYVTSRALHLAAWSACWRLAEGRDPGADPAVAGYWVGEQLRPAVAVCHHLHGGLGLDRSYPLHRFAAAATELAWFVGGPERDLDLLADELYGPRES